MNKANRLLVTDCKRAVSDGIYRRLRQPFGLALLALLVLQKGLDQLVVLAGTLIVLARELSHQGVVDALFGLVFEDDGRDLAGHLLVVDHVKYLVLELILQFLSASAAEILHQLHRNTALLPG